MAIGFEWTSVALLSGAWCQSLSLSRQTGLRCQVRLTRDWCFEPGSLDNGPVTQQQYSRRRWMEGHIPTGMTRILGAKIIEKKCTLTHCHHMSLHTHLALCCVLKRGKIMFLELEYRVAGSMIETYDPDPLLKQNQVYFENQFSISIVMQIYFLCRIVWVAHGLHVSNMERASGHTGGHTNVRCEQAPCFQRETRYTPEDASRSAAGHSAVISH